MRHEPFADDALSEDRFLGGRARLLQPIKGYRAGIDPVLLAASINAEPGQSVLELGCGGGVGLVLLGKRVPNLRLHGLDLQPGYADLARRNLALNDLSGQIFDGDLAAMPAPLKALSFDHVTANPPFFLPDARIKATDSGRETALAGETDLSLWIAAATKRLKPFGYLTIIQRIERLPDMLSSLPAVMGSCEVWPMAPRTGRAAHLVLLRARKEGRAAFRLHAPLILHSDAADAANGQNYTPCIEAAVREGAALPFPTTR